MFDNETPTVLLTSTLTELNKKRDHLLQHIERYSEIVNSLELERAELEEKIYSFSKALTVITQ